MKLSIAALTFLYCAITYCLPCRGADSPAPPPTKNMRHTDVPFLLTATQQGKAEHFRISAESQLPETGNLPEQFKQMTSTELNIFNNRDSNIWHGGSTITMTHHSTNKPAVVDVLLYNDYQWSPDLSMDNTLTGRAEARVYNRNRQLVFDTTIEFRFTPPPKPDLALHMNIQRTPDRNFQINLNVVRLAATKNEFLPSGLTHDYLIFNSDGTLIWQMSADKTYTQIITDVQPTNIGGSANYTDVWNGEGNATQGEIMPGRYTLVSIIPCKPVAAQDSIHFIVQ